MRKTVTEEEVIDYLSKKLGITLTSNSKFFDDLHIDGLDAETLMLDLSKDFSLPLDKFDYRKYFLSDGELANIFLSVYNAIFRRKQYKKKYFTVEHLVNAINKGEWFDPE